MSDGPIVMLACYQIDPEARSSFLQLLKDTEAVYRAAATLTDTAIIRMESFKDPAYIVEIIEWKDRRTLASVMENEQIMEKWSEIKACWKNGDFPISELPEGSIPWAVLRRIA